MRRLYLNSPQMVMRRKLLRNNPTKEEVKLWYRLKGSQMGFKFTRQYSIGNYVVDFYCSEKRLAIELDGSQHNSDENKIYDFARTKYINQFGIRLLRFWNSDVLNNISSVLEGIYRELSGITP